MNVNLFRDWKVLVGKYISSHGELHRCKLFYSIDFTSTQVIGCLFRRCKVAAYCSFHKYFINNERQRLLLKVTMDAILIYFNHSDTQAVANYLFWID